MEESESDGDFSADDSDEFNPIESSSEDSSDDCHSETESPPKKTQSVASRVLKTPSVSISTASTTRRSARNKGDYQYILQSDDYFSSATSKTKTSDHTLDRLKNPRLPHDQLIKLLSNMKLSKEHETAVKELNEEYKNNFGKWLTLFDEGYTVLLHGLGSKRNLLQAFHKEKLADQHVIVINGFFPSLTFKDILDSIAVDILELSASGANPHEIINAIEAEMSEIPTFHLFLIVHNIDGTMLRNDKAQSVLSRLAGLKNVHMIASIDHINAPLCKSSDFHFKILLIKFIFSLSMEQHEAKQLQLCLVRRHLISALH
jgi:origin recognition complex subunit 2